MRSDTVKKGVQQAPHRSLFNALGMTQEELDRPLIGVVSSYNEIVPGHMNLDKITEAVKMGVAMAVFPSFFHYILSGASNPSRSMHVSNTRFVSPRSAI